MGHAGGHSDDAVPSTQEVWDERRIESLGGPLISAANAAGIGLSVVRLDGEPRVVRRADPGADSEPRQLRAARC